MEKVKVGPFGNAEMEAEVSRFAPKNWLYLDFGKRQRACIDLGSGELVKGQSHKAPLIPKDEIERLVEKYKTS